MVIKESDEPPLSLNVAIVYNIKKAGKFKAVDDEAEYDSIDTVLSLKRIFEDCGHNVSLFEADEEMPTKLKNSHIDLAFNIAEGRNTRGREGQAPAMLSMLNIPFSGSDQTTLCMCLDKALTKRFLSTYHIKTPKYTVINKDTNLNKIKLGFPVILKPNSEGSSKGISDVCVAKTLEELKKIAKNTFDMYGQDMLVEEYIHGKEFTVGVLGNKEDIKVFTPMEIVYKKPTQGDFCVYSYNVKQNYKIFVDYKCPSDIDKKIEKKMIKISRKIYDALQCKDFSRIDFRVSDSGDIYFIEINPLPGLTPNYSDYPILASKCGVNHDDLIKRILNSAIKRYGLMAK